MPREVHPGSPIARRDAALHRRALRNFEARGLPHNDAMEAHAFVVFHTPVSRPEAKAGTPLTTRVRASVSRVVKGVILAAPHLLETKDPKA